MTSSIRTFAPISRAVRPAGAVVRALVATVLQLTQRGAMAVVVIRSRSPGQGPPGFQRR